MHRPQILRALKLPKETALYCLGMEMQAWGRDLFFLCQASPSDAAILPFRLCFSDCRETRWQIYTHLESADAFPASELASFTMGRNQHRSPARLLTDYFGLALIYGELWVEFGDKKIALELPQA